jgi:hypothetical protein
MAKYKNIKSAVHNFGYSFLNGPARRAARCANGSNAYTARP